jgi:poly(hydroxyalkanoate) depolymerase family esterase
MNATQHDAVLVLRRRKLICSSLIGGFMAQKIFILVLFVALLGCHSQSVHAQTQAQRTTMQNFCALYPLIPVCLFSDNAAPTGMTEGRGTTTSGARNYFVHIPEMVKSGALKNAPALVVLHGCLQSPALIASGTGMNELADKYGFVVIYPEQTVQFNFQSCWNWYAPENLQRSGEAEIIASITNDVVKQYQLNASRVFISGMSAGGAMTSNLLACYSNIFAAGAIHSGLPYAVAENQIQASVAMQNGGGFDPAQAATRAYHCSPQRRLPVPVLIIHGDQDSTVSVKNAGQNFALFENLNDLIDDGKINGSTGFTRSTAEIPAVSSGALSATVTSDISRGQTLVKLVTVHGMGHAWSGGLSGGSYTDPNGPGASQLIVEFFKLNQPDNLTK